MRTIYLRVRLVVVFRELRNRRERNRRERNRLPPIILAVNNLKLDFFSGNRV